MSLHVLAQIVLVIVVFSFIGDWKWPGNIVKSILRPFGFEKVTDNERAWLENERAKR